MKKLLATLALIALTHYSHATAYNVTAQVKQINSLDRVTYGTNADSFSLIGFSSAGSCATGDGLIAITLRDDEGGKRQMSILLSAKAAGLPVSVRVDDTVKNGAGFCYLQVLSI